jgi:hypothetical protein
MLKLFLDFFDKGGDFNPSCNIEITQSITGKDISFLYSCKEKQIYSSIKDNIIKRFINAFGINNWTTLYRGLSNDELEAVFNYTQMMNNKNKKTCKLVDSKSFTPHKYVAENFSKQYSGKLMTITSIKKTKILYLDEIIFLS